MMIQAAFDRRLSGIGRSRLIFSDRKEKMAPDEQKEARTGTAPVSDVPAWHVLTIKETEALLGSKVDGLGEGEVRERRLRFGPNSLPQPKTRGPLLRFLTQFDNLLIQV